MRSSASAERTCGRCRGADHGACVSEGGADEEAALLHVLNLIDRNILRHLSKVGAHVALESVPNTLPTSPSGVSIYSTSAVQNECCRSGHHSDGPDGPGQLRIVMPPRRWTSASCSGEDG